MSGKGLYFLYVTISEKKCTKDFLNLLSDVLN